MRIEELLRAHARRSPKRIIASAGDHHVSYGEIEDRSSRLCNSFLALGLRPGDRIVCALPNCIEFVEILFGAAKANLIIVPVNSRSTSAELQFILRHANARALIGEMELIERFETAAKPDALLITLGAQFGGATNYESLIEKKLHAEPNTGFSDNDAWAFAYTSGSTGTPKAVVLSHRAKALSAITEALFSEFTSEDVTLINTPLFHVHGIVLALTAIAAGGRIVITPDGSPQELLRIVKSEPITQLAMVPTMYRAVLDCVQIEPVDFSQIKAARCTGAPLTSALKAELKQRFPELPLFVMYGATEAGAVTILEPGELFVKDGSVGRPHLGVELQVRDAMGNLLRSGEIGEVHIRSGYVFDGYLLDETLPTAPPHRWITMGDLGWIDEDGFLFLAGRSSEMIISGGENIAPQEVEAALEQHPSVSAVAVIGVSDPFWGEKTTAIVELRPGCDASAAELLEVAAKYLSRHKLPKEIEIVDKLPRNPFGKIDKKALRSPKT